MSPDPAIIYAPEPLFTERLAPDKLKKAISNSLARDPVVLAEGQRGAFVTVINLDLIEVAVATKIIDGERIDWNVDLIASHAWSGDNQFSVLSKVVW